jgi:peptidyl-prolyl cis-trans isomerase C
MNPRNGSTSVGTRSAKFSVTAMLALGASVATAESVATINGTDIDSTVLEVYAESRTQRPLADITAQDRNALVADLKDLYILSTQPVSDDLKSDPRIAAQIELQERLILAQAFAQKFVMENAATDEEILAEYSLRSDSAPPLQFKARHILVSTQGEAMELITKLDSGGDFATLAIDSSTGPSAKDGGALPWFSPNQMVKPFSDAVAALEDGKYTAEPIQTEFGWHVILREDSRENQPPPLESVRDEIRQNVAQKKFQAHLEKLRTDAASTN